MSPASVRLIYTLEIERGMINCHECQGDCCKYVAIEIDEPESMEDMDKLRWFLAHENVRVYKDNEGDWLVEFQTPCKHLSSDHRCAIYEKRPTICREHGVDECIRNGEGEVEEILFLTMEDVDRYAKEHFPVKEPPRKRNKSLAGNASEELQIRSPV